MMPAAAQPRGQPEEVAGGVRPRWDTSNPVAWLGQKGRNTGMPLSPLLCAAWHGLSPALAALGSPKRLLGVFPSERMVLAQPWPLSLFIPLCLASAAPGARPCGIPQGSQA